MFENIFSCSEGKRFPFSGPQEGLKMWGRGEPLLDGTVKLGDKERFDKEQIGIKEPFLLTNLQFTS